MWYKGVSDMARRRRGTLFQKKGLLSAGSKTRKALTWLLCSAVVIILVAVIVFFQLLGWVQGDEFRKQLADDLCNKAQAESVRIPENLQLDGNLLSLPSFSLTRADMLQQASARRLTAAIDRGELLDRRLHITKMNLEEVSVRLDTSRFHAPLPPLKPTHDSFWSRFTPNQTILDGLECSDVDLELLHDGNLYSLMGCSLTAAPHVRQKDAWQFNLENGRFHNPLPYLQDCSIKNASLTWRPGRFLADECLVMLNPGELRLSGSYQMKGRQWDMELRASKANVARLLSADWKKRLTGELYGTLRISGKGPLLRKGSGTLTLKGAVLEGLPVLSELPIGSGRPYRSLPLEKAECRLSYPYAEPSHNISDAWLFDQIDVRSQGGNLLVRGHVIVGSDGSLGGTLTIGLPESIVASLPLPQSSLASLFNGKGETGYRWLNLNLSGTVDAPQEDLSVRLSTILKGLLPDAAGHAADTASNLLNTLLFSGKGQEGASVPDSQGEQQPAPSADDPMPGVGDPDTPDEQGPAGIMEGAGQLFGSGLKALF